MARQAYDESGSGWQVIRPGAVQVLNVTDTAAPSDAFSDPCEVIRIVSTTDCYIAVGATPVATSNHTFLPANLVEYFRVANGDKLSVIRDTADGTINITEAS